MATLVHEYDSPDRAVIGTVGPPGSRTFYLQARTGSHITSVALEKQLSQGIADAVDELIDTRWTGDAEQLAELDRAAVQLFDADPLDQPVEEDFRMGQLRMYFDERSAQVVIEAYPMVEAETEEEAAALAGTEPPEAMVLRMPVGTARAFAERARRVVAAGRPICPACGEPVDAEGHVCPADGDR